MIKQIKENLTLVLWLFISISILFFFTESLYEQKQIDDYLIEFNDKNNIINKKNINQKSDLHFFESRFYKDIYAKENLNLLNFREKIIIIEDNFLEKDFFLKQFLTEKFVDREKFTNIEKWGYFFNLR